MNKLTLVLSLFFALKGFGQTNIEAAEGYLEYAAPYKDGYVAIANYNGYIEYFKKEVHYFDKDGQLKWHKQIDLLGPNQFTLVNNESDYFYQVANYYLNVSGGNHGKNENLITIHQIDAEGNIKEKEFGYTSHFSELLGDKKCAVNLSYAALDKNGLVFIITKEYKREKENIEEYYLVFMDHSFQFSGFKIGKELKTSDSGKNRSRPKVLLDGDNLQFIQITRLDVGLGLEITTVGLVERIVREERQFVLLTDVYVRSKIGSPKFSSLEVNNAFSYIHSRGDNYSYGLGALLDFQIDEGKLYCIGYYTNKKVASYADGILWFEIPINSDELKIESNQLNKIEFERKGASNHTSQIKNGKLTYVVEYSAGKYARFGEGLEEKIDGKMGNDYVLLFGENAKFERVNSKVEKWKNVQTKCSRKEIFIYEKYGKQNRTKGSKMIRILELSSDI